MIFVPGLSITDVAKVSTLLAVGCLFAVLDYWDIVLVCIIVWFYMLFEVLTGRKCARLTKQTTKQPTTKQPNQETATTG